MHRNALAMMETWLRHPDRKPLLMFGARQTGKSWLMAEFARRHFPQDHVSFDLERNGQARKAFEYDLEPLNLIRRLEQVAGQPIRPGSTLLILDEIQASNRALASLKYMQEELPQLHVIAAGSLLGIAVKTKGFTMPVGKVDTMTLTPMGFDEYLMALGEGSFVEEIRRCYDTASPFYLHDEMIERLWTYLLVGGMPEAVRTYVSTNDLSEVRRRQLDILDLYAADMTKYATPAETARIRDVWSSIPRQLAKENHKFQYKAVRTGARSSTHAAAIAWLLSAGLVNRCVQITDGHSPIAMHENVDSFKIYALDCGLLAAQSGLTAPMLLNAENRRLLDLNGITENHVAQALAAHGIPLRYWVSGGTAEVDFVIEPNDTITGIPIEVKSSTNTRSRSLNSYISKYAPSRAIRLSTKNFGEDNGILSAPLYAAFCVHG